MSNLRPDPAALPSGKHVSVVNLANALTVLRLALIPVFVFFLLHGDGHDTPWRIGAAVVFAIAVITDKYDGDIARSRGLITDFGKLADPIADKALIGAAMIGLSLLGDLAWWVTVVILIREVGVTLLRFWVIRHGIIAASRGGKAKTLAQALAIWMYILPLTGFLASARWWLMAVAIVLTIITGLDYVARAIRLRRGGQPIAAIAPVTPVQTQAPVVPSEPPLAGDKLPRE